MLFCILVHDHTLCFSGSPYHSVSYYEYSLYKITTYLLTSHVTNGFAELLYLRKM